MNADRISSQAVIGLLVAAIGVLLLLSTTEVASVNSVIRWTPSLFILFGLWRLAANGFERIVGPVLIIVIAGFVQLLALDIEVGNLWPAILIIVGLAIILRRVRGRRSVASDKSGAGAGDIDTFSMFSSVKRSVTSGDFQGGQATALMGSVQLDMRDAAVLEKPVTLEVTSVMGEVRLRVPSDWTVQLDNSTLLGETEDKRPRSESLGGSPDLVIAGLVLMGSLKIDD